LVQDDAMEKAVAEETPAVAPGGGRMAYDVTSLGLGKASVTSTGVTEPVYVSEVGQQEAAAFAERSPFSGTGMLPIDRDRMCDMVRTPGQGHGRWDR
jgi:hypothetical protein